MGDPTADEWTGLLARFPEASPELLGRRELRRRTDTKFVVTPKCAAEVLSTLTDDYTVLVAGSRLFGSYRTLYFDTPELDCFHAQRRGRRVRHKVRIRHYLDRELTVLEVKTRESSSRTRKSWRERATGDDEFREDDQKFVSDRTGIEDRMQPQARTRFERLTLLNQCKAERVTVDLELRVEANGRTVSLAPIAVIEVKQWPASRETSVMSALRRAGRRPGWISKYAVAIAYTRPEVRRNALLPGLRRLEREMS